MTKQYWHFCRNDKRLGYKDGRRIKLNRKLTVKGQPILCRHGLHASTRLVDALEYAQGHIVCRVVLGGIIVKGDDKVVAQTRTVTQWANVEALLHEFACRCAETALKQAKVTDPRCWAAIATKRQWLANRATDAQLAAAWDAARDAARDAWDAARDAARDARAAARAAARDAAWDAARDAARDARDAAWDAHNRRLTAMISAKLRTV